MDKNSIRTKNISLRRNLNQKDASLKIVSKILAWDIFCAAKNILIFYPLKHEIDLTRLTKTKDKNFFLPRIKNFELEICPFSGELKKSAFGTLEPQTAAIDVSLIDLCFIPAVCADKNLNRIGYGKGYYDRLFSNPEFCAKKAVVINKELVLNSIPADKFDKKADFIITD